MRTNVLFVEFMLLFVLLDVVLVALFEVLGQNDVSVWKTNDININHYNNNII